MYGDHDPNKEGGNPLKSPRSIGQAMTSNVSEVLTS
jgi:hypothetical protein